MEEKEEVVYDIELKFNPLTSESKKVVRELEDFFDNCTILYSSEDILNIGESIFFMIPDENECDDFLHEISIEHYSDSFNYESDVKQFYAGFNLLSERAKKYFNDLCKNNRLKIVEKRPDIMELTLIINEYYVFN